MDERRAKIIWNTVTVILLIILFFGLFRVWQIEHKKFPEQKLKVYFLDVGQGDSILIEAPNKVQMLVDGGQDKKVLSALSKILPFSDNKIEIVLGTHPDSDHIGGLSEIMNRYKVDKLLLTVSTSTDKSSTETFQKLLLTASSTGVVVEKIYQGYKIILDPVANVSADVLWPDKNFEAKDTNQMSAVLKLTMGKSDFLLTGDADKMVENKIIDSGLDIQVEVLKLGHHGSKTSSDNLFIEKTNSNFFIVSAGKNNKYGHPSSETIDTIQKFITEKKPKSEILETSKEGTIKFETNGETLERVKLKSFSVFERFVSPFFVYSFDTTSRNN